VKLGLRLQPNYVVNEGSSISLVCDAVGYPSPKSIQWTYNNDQFHGLANSTNYVITEKRKSIGEMSSTLQILDANKNLGGRYSCRGSDALNETNLVVKSKQSVLMTQILWNFILNG